MSTKYKLLSIVGHFCAIALLSPVSCFSSSYPVCTSPASANYRVVHTLGDMMQQYSAFSGSGGQYRAENHPLRVYCQKEEDRKESMPTGVLLHCNSSGEFDRVECFFCSPPAGSDWPVGAYVMCTGETHGASVTIPELTCYNVLNSPDLGTECSAGRSDPFAGIF